MELHGDWTDECLKGFPVNTEWKKLKEKKLVMPLINYSIKFNEFRASLDKTQKCSIFNDTLQATSGEHFTATLLSVLF